MEYLMDVINEDRITGQYYRVSYDGKGVYVALKEKVGWDWKNVKQDPDINWLPTPTVEYKDEYRSFFTRLGYNTFKAKTMKVIDKYLDPKKIKVKEYNDLEGEIMYRDHYQVVVNNKDYVNESTITYVLSGDDIAYRLEEFERGDINVCYVIGLSGSGKSTLAREMSSYYKCEYVELDELLKVEITNPTVIEFLKVNSYPCPVRKKKEMTRNEKIEFHRSLMDIYKVMLIWLNQEGKQGRRFVVDGCQVFELYDDKEWSKKEDTIFKESALVVKGTSVLKSLCRRIGRDGIYSGLISKPWTIISWYIKGKGFISNMEKDYGDGTVYHMNESGSEGNNIVFSEDDTYVNWEKWVSGESHVLFVIGLSGSGKSTLAKKMANEYDANYVEIDVIAFKIVGQRSIERGYNTIDHIQKDDPFLWKYMKEKHIKPDFMSHLSTDPDTFRHTDEEEEFKRQEVDKYIHWLCFEQKERVVIEGGHAGVTITRHPEIYKDLPIIFKGTSLTKSVFRRMMRAGKKGKVYSPIRWINIIRTQYLDKMLPEVDASRKAVLSGRDDIIMVKEGVTSFGTMDIDISDRNQHNYKSKKIKVPNGIKNFKEFCQKIPNPVVALAWFIKNKIKWTPNGGDNDHAFQWPDYLISQKMGNCFDQTIFMHYYCQKKHIEHKMFLITWIGDNGNGSGHAVPMYKKGDYVYVWLYLRPGVGQIGGPFRSWDEAQDTLNYYFSVAINRIFHTPTTPYSSFLSDEDLRNFDQYYNNRKITQTEYITMGLGSNMRSSHMFKLKYKGFMFPNPVLPAYDVVIGAIRLLAFANQIIPLPSVDKDKER